MNKSESIKELLKAVSKFQGELENVEKAKAGHGYGWTGTCGIESASNIHDVGNYGGSRHFSPRTSTIVKCRSNGISVYNHCIHHSMYIGNQAMLCYQGWMHSQFDAFFC